MPTESAEQLVKAQWPEAVCEERVSSRGSDFAIYYDTPGGTYLLLGSGPTPEEAWEDARRRLGHGSANH